LDIGDLKVTKTYSYKLKNQYIEHLNLNKTNAKSGMILLFEIHSFLISF